MKNPTNSIQGKIILIDETQQVTDKFMKRRFVIETTEEKYPQLIPFDLVQDRVDLIDMYKVGDTVQVAYNIRGFQWDKGGQVQYGSSLQAWMLKKETPATPAPQPTADVNVSTADNSIPF